MQDHYNTLGLSLGASRVEVKRAFRRLAKKYHPDRNAARSAWATTRMQQLVEAHGVLSDAYAREVYDRKYMLLIARRQPDDPSTYRRQRADGPAAKAERILEDLLSGREAQAVQSYEKLIAGEKGFDLHKYMSLRDWVDCKFLIAEQYQNASEYEKALVFYEELYHSSEARKRYANFMREVHDRIVRICCRHLAPAASPEAAAQYYLRALAIEQARGRRAFLHKKLAECHLAVGDHDAARRQLRIAFDLRPDLKGATKICRRLNFVRG